ncbi:GtrA family protein [Primorskyibacter aestuariivivens]|uniref:GtrA family protein n=1 Tax=Primorskyibacter aestuariivivens TaxID=1888912 RepID=UPI002300B56F|nr:GtrA family protein [Primorskyibacter aestuariivivens]MDA7427606.1 GtrA family protein [Primorskyibacter aestuariivivens]
MRDNQLGRYIVTGICVTLFYVLVYPVLRRAGLGAVPANLTAYCSAVALQYVMHARYTFAVSTRNRSQARRFGITIALGLALSTLITAGIAPRIGMSPFWAATCAAVLIPVLNWILFRFWVFRTEAPHGS